MRDEAEKFNARWEVGEAFVYRPIAGSNDGARVTRTRSAAWCLGSGTAVVLVRGVTGCVAIDHLTRHVDTDNPSPGPGPEDRARLAWAVETFGPIAADDRDRALRFLEEALELVQAAGLEMLDVANMADRVFDRPAGDLEKEIGQAGLTLGMLATSLGFSLQMLVAAEFARVSKIPREEWAARHAEKVDQGLASPMEPAE